MEQLLKYYYNMYIEKVLKEYNYYYFYYDGYLYYLIKNYRTEKEINELYLICEELYNKNIVVSTFIINNQGKIISEYNNNTYILLKINSNTSLDFSIKDIVNFQNILEITNNKTNLYRTNWGLLWEEKNDYFEYQIKELGINKKVILNSFSYYIGLSENAISIVNIVNLNNKNKKVVLSHKRVNYPNMEVDFLNPLNFIFDINVRDIAEYLKSMFFKTNVSKTIKELKKYLNSVNLTDYEANMLYARLLYPSYYFDVYEQVIEDKIDEEELLPIISKVDDYELFLKDVYYELIKTNKIEKVEWLIRKEL